MPMWGGEGEEGGILHADVRGRGGGRGTDLSYFISGGILHADAYDFLPESVVIWELLFVSLSYQDTSDRRWTL